MLIYTKIINFPREKFNKAGVFLRIAISFP